MRWNDLATLAMASVCVSGCATGAKSPRNLGSPAVGFAGQAVISLASLDGTSGFRLEGVDAFDNSGRTVASAGDVNGDGFDDLIIAAPKADPGGNDHAGEVYVVFGSPEGFGASLSLASLDGTNGFRLDGIDEDHGNFISIAGAGDFNGDGLDDLIIGASEVDPGGNDRAGETYVVFGSSEGFGASLSLASLDGTNGFRLVGVRSNDYSGRSVAGAGDVNADGFDDLIVGAPGASTRKHFGAGETYVVFGAPSGFSARFSLANLDGTSGFRLDGTKSQERSGDSIASAGDVNGDGFDDLIIGAPWADRGGNRFAGATYVVFGRRGGFDANHSLADLDGTSGFRLDGVDAFDTSGRSVAGAGDVNGDGFDDFIIGVDKAKPNRPSAHQAFVVFGAANRSSSSLSLASIDGTNGFQIDGIGEHMPDGLSFAAAGDVNGDGLDDLIIGETTGDPGDNSFAGQSFVVFGSSGGFGASLSLASLDGTNGFRLDGIDGNDFSGSSVAGAGDVNGDGFADLIIGAPLADHGNRFNAGETYVVFGGPGRP